MDDQNEDGEREIDAPSQDGAAADFSFTDLLNFSPSQSERDLQRLFHTYTDEHLEKDLADQIKTNFDTTSAGINANETGMFDPAHISVPQKESEPLLSTESALVDDGNNIDPDWMAFVASGLRSPYPPLPEVGTYIPLIDGSNEGYLLPQGTPLFLTPGAAFDQANSDRLDNMDLAFAVSYQEQQEIDPILDPGLWFSCFPPFNLSDNRNDYFLDNNAFSQNPGSHHANSVMQQDVVPFLEDSIVVQNSFPPATLSSSSLLHPNARGSDPSVLSYDRTANPNDETLQQNESVFPQGLFLPSLQPICSLQKSNPLNADSDRSMYESDQMLADHQIDNVGSDDVDVNDPKPSFQYPDIPIPDKDDPDRKTKLRARKAARERALRTARREGRAPPPIPRRSTHGNVYNTTATTGVTSTIAVSHSNQSDRATAKENTDVQKVKLSDVRSNIRSSLLPASGPSAFTMPASQAIKFDPLTSQAQVVSRPVSLNDILPISKPGPRPTGRVNWSKRNAMAEDLLELNTTLRIEREAREATQQVCDAQQTDSTQTDIDVHEHNNADNSATQDIFAQDPNKRYNLRKPY